MNEILEYIQIEALKIYKKKYSKKYIKLRILPIINYINSSNKKKFLIGGSQGIGKSSLIILIKKTLEKYNKKKILLLSLDDYYLSKKERQILAKKNNELLITRGVPGTHDIQKLIMDIKKFELNKYPIEIPIFDKLIDNKTNKKNIINKKCDLLILEGWCCGCSILDKNYLYKNINFIEKKFDKNFKWRDFYNNKLNNEYKNLFKLFDEKIFLRAPSFKYVLNWRIKQERRNFSIFNKSKKMNSDEIKLFIQHYEKITKWMLKKFKNFANLVVKIDKNQKIISIEEIRKKSIF